MDFGAIAVIDSAQFSRNFVVTTLKVIEQMGNKLPKPKIPGIRLDQLKLKVTNKILFSSLIGFLTLLGISTFWFKSRYDFDNQMTVKLQELSNAEYPANPAPLGKNFQRYSNRKLTIIKRDETHFDFVLEPTNNKTAKIVIKNVLEGYL